MDQAEAKVYFYWLLGSKPHRAYNDINNLASVGNRHPVGIWVGQGHVFISDSSDARVYAYNRTEDRNHVPSRDISATALTNAGATSPRGIQGDGSILWIVNHSSVASAVKLFAFNMSDGSRNSAKDVTVVGPAGNLDPWGIWGNDEGFLVVDGADNKLYAYDVATTNEAACGICKAGNFLYIADALEAKIYAYNATDGTRIPAHDFNSLVDAGNLNPMP